MISECRKRMYNNQLKESDNQPKFKVQSGNEHGLPRTDAAWKTNSSHPVMYIQPEPQEILEAESAPEFEWPM